MGTAGPSAVIPQRGFSTLIRYSHIVSSAVREILEQDPLRDAGGGDMTPRQLQLLEFIAAGGHHVDSVAKFLRVTPPAATKAVDKLERRGLVERAGCAGDRRLTMVVCTGDGLRLVERYRVLQQSTMGTVTGALSREEIAELTERLRQFALALVAADTNGTAPCLRCSGYYERDCPLQFTHRGCAYAAAGIG